MTDTEFKNIISEFDEIKTVKLNLDKLKSEVLKARRQLKTLRHKFSFLSDIVSIDGKDDLIEKGLRTYFKFLSADKVELVGKKFGEEDLRIWFGDKLLLIEATGHDKPIPKDDKIFQILKHIPIRQNKFKEYKVSGLFVVNHDNKKSFTDRKTPFDKRLKEFAVANKLCLITTKDLVLAFLDIKNNKIKPGELFSKLASPGVFENIG